MPDSTRGTIPTRHDQPRWRLEVRCFGELFALAGLAIAQPLLDIFGRAPDQFIFRGAGRGDVIGFGVIVVVVPALAAYLLEVGLGVVTPRLRRGFHLTVIGVLTTVLLIPLLDHFLPRIPAILLAAGGALLFAAAHHRTRGPRIWLAFLTPTPPVFLAVFLLGSQTAPLLRDGAVALETTVGAPAPTIVVVFDEFPLSILLDEDGDIDADLYPNFARLANTSHWFRQTTTVTNYTTTAIPAMLTGKLPGTGAAATSAGFPENLFTLVGDTMPVTSSEVVTNLCPSSVCDQLTFPTGGLRSLLGDAIAALRHRIEPGPSDIDPTTAFVEPGHDTPAQEIDGLEEWYAPSDGGITRFSRFLDELDGSVGLRYIHLLLPHRPFRFLPDGTVYPWADPEIGIDGDDLLDDPEPVTVTHQQFLLQMQWTDELVGRLIDHLHTNGSWDDTNLAIIADHGLGLEPGGPLRGLFRNTDHDTAMAQLLWVPFFLKEAGQTVGTVSDDPVQIIDLTPTLAGVLDVDIPWDTDGRSAFDGGSGDPDEAELHVSTFGPEVMVPDRVRTLDRSTGHDLLLQRTAGSIAPPADGIHGSDRIYRIGPRPDLWGEPLPSDSEPLDVTFDDLESTEIGSDRRSSAALVRAKTTASVIGRNVAVAVDGTIWATGVVYEHDGARIAAILPPQAFETPSAAPTVHLLD